MTTHVERLNKAILTAACCAEACAKQLREIAGRVEQDGDVGLASEAADELMRLISGLPFSQLAHIPFEAKQAELLTKHE